MFSTTIIENIRFGNNDVSEEQIMEVCDVANI